MIAQGTSLIDTAYFDRLTEQLERVTEAADLQKLVDDAAASLVGQLGGVQAQLDKLSPMRELLTLDITDLPQVLTFLGKLKDTLLTPLIGPFDTYVAQIAAFTTSIAGLAAAVTAASDRIGANVSLPVIPLPVVP